MNEPDNSFGDQLDPGKGLKAVETRDSTTSAAMCAALLARDHPFRGMPKLLARPNMESERLELPGLMTTSVPSRGSVGGWGDEADAICSRLMRETGCGEAEAAIAVDGALEHFRGARIREFVALLAERDARRQLRAWSVDPMRTIESEAGRRRGISRGGRDGQDNR